MLRKIGSNDLMFQVLGTKSGSQFGYTPSIFYVFFLLFAFMTSDFPFTMSPYWDPVATHNTQIML